MDDVALTAYLERIGVARADATLDAILWGHVTSIPFENLDILLGRPIELELEAIHAKLVTRRRGGYCFEHNALLAAALEALGFTVTRLAARVRWLASGPTPRTHMLLAVETRDGRVLCDVGFGGSSPTGPIPLRAGAEVALHHTRYRLVEDCDALLLQLLVDGAWADLYAFTLEPQLAVDYEVANHFTSTHPRSHFTRGPVVALTVADGRVTLRGVELTRRLVGEVTRETISDPERYLAVLAELGLAFPPGTRFRGGPENV
jgi:N-hydroxyarylamine O-acetyltransferase